MDPKTHQRRTVSIRGVLTLTAPAHQTSPDGKTEGLTSQMKTSVLSASQNTLLYNVPFITANSVRALIRRAAGGVIMKELERSENQISRNMYLSIMRGGFARTGINAGGATYQQLIAAQDHLFAGLFGGGANMYPSTVRMERDLYPMLDSLRNLFPARYQPSCTVATPDQLLTKLLIASRDDFERLPQGDIIENASEAYLEHMTAKFGANLAKKEQKATAKADGTRLNAAEKLKTDDLNTFTMVEAIIPGAPLYFGITAKQVTDAQIGLLLNAITDWANRNALGGGSVRGRGSFAASLQLTEGEDVLSDNLLVSEAPSYTLSDSASVFTRAMQAQLEEAALPKTLISIYPTEIAAKKAPKVKAAAEAVS